MNAYLGSQSPRRLMAAVGAGMGLANGVFTGIQADEAPPLVGAPPAVDRLAVTVVTDSYHHNFEASGKFCGVDVQRYTMPPSNEPPRRILQNEWGLALHVESARGSETRRVLIDFGYTHETIKVSGVSRVHAILGGFHLMPMPAEYAQETARAMAQFEPDCLIPMHCSGENFFDAAKQAMPGRVVRTSTGTRFMFGTA